VVASEDNNRFIVKEIVLGVGELRLESQEVKSGLQQGIGIEV